MPGLLPACSAVHGLDFGNRRLPGALPAPTRSTYQDKGPLPLPPQVGDLLAAHWRPQGPQPAGQVRKQGLQAGAVPGRGGPALVQRIQ